METKIIKGYKVTLWKFDCSEEKIAPIQINTYLHDSKLLQKVQNEADETAMFFVISDTVGERFFKEFCGKGK